MYRAGLCEQLRWWCGCCVRRSVLQLLAALRCCQPHGLMGGRRTLGIEDLRGITVMRKLDPFFPPVSVLAVFYSLLHFWTSVGVWRVTKKDKAGGGVACGRHISRFVRKAVGVHWSHGAQHGAVWHGLMWAAAKLRWSQYFSQWKPGSQIW